MRIAIVNDVNLVTELLRRMVSGVSGYEVVWVARNGAEAVEKCAEEIPDLILMDLGMPVMDGVEATRRIMNKTPCPILIVTSTVDGNAGKVFEAMGHGALDVVSTPQAGDHEAAKQSQEALLKKIQMIKKLGGIPPRGARAKGPSVSQEKMPDLVVIGASTGGPKALAEILSRLPATFGAAIVIVQHVDREFSAGLAQWLSTQTSLKVQLARQGMSPEPGQVYVAGTNDHLVITANHTFAYTQEPKDSPYRPSVDTFFRSVNAHWPMKGIAVLLTGMGKDGAEGLGVLRQAGWHTLAQDEESSVVYGMPKAAKTLGAAVQILPVKEMAAAIEGLLTKAERANGMGEQNRQARVLKRDR